MPLLKTAEEYEEDVIRDIKSTEENVDSETNNLELDPPAEFIKDEEAVKWFNQITNLENAKVGAKQAKEKLQAKYTEDWYLKKSKNGRIKILINGEHEIKWESTFTKANPKPKPTEEKHGTQFVIKSIKKKKVDNEASDTQS